MTLKFIKSRKELVAYVVAILLGGFAAIAEEVAEFPAYSLLGAVVLLVTLVAIVDVKYDLNVSDS